jgi:hypothetical protein
VRAQNVERAREIPKVALERHDAGHHRLQLVEFHAA